MIFSGLDEVKSKLKLIRPKTLGQALRIDRFTPAAAIILLGAIRGRVSISLESLCIGSQVNSKLLYDLNFNEKLKH